MSSDKAQTSLYCVITAVTMYNVHVVLCYLISFLSTQHFRNIFGVTVF